ncbi:LTA synthase family protein [Viscerimonas tarda]
MIMQNLRKTRLYLFLSAYITLVLLFVIQKPLFLLYHLDQSGALSWGDWFRVALSGLPMDLSMSGYLMIIPGILILLSVWFTKCLKPILKVYFIFISIAISIIFVPDLHLYSFWGFRIDSTIFAYLGSPKEVFASMPWYVGIASFVVMAIWSFLQFFVLKKIVIDRFPIESAKSKIKPAIALLVLLGLMFIPIRGGVTTSTMNPGYVYFSENMFLNHAALNPVFNMFYSLKQQKDFNKQFRFMDDKVAHEIMDDLMRHNEQDSIPRLLTTDRPNIIFIIMESFGAKIVEPLGGVEGVAPNLNKLTEEGVFFRKMYANSFRTDRGIVSVLGGYPAQPNMSILKYTKKVQTLSSIPKSLIQNGYKGSFLYGGDLDFAQMKLFAVTQNITDLTEDTDFPMNMRLTKWGVPDAFTFERFAKDVVEEKQEPFVKIFLTLSSHEPFDVPTNKFEEPYLNSVAYTDSCLGLFIDKLKQSPQWNNSLVVLVPDHDMRFPKTLEHFSPDRHDIFMLWLGGSLKEPAVIDKLCSQADIASILLHQLNIASDEFTFSKNILNPSVNSFAFYTFPNGFGMISETGKVAYDSDSKKAILLEGAGTDSLLLQGKALLQCLYDDIQGR